MAFLAVTSSTPSVVIQVTLGLNMVEVYTTCSWALFPAARHDGTHYQEPFRKKWSGKSLGYQGLLVEVKG